MNIKELSMKLNLLLEVNVFFTSLHLLSCSFSYRLNFIHVSLVKRPVSGFIMTWERHVVALQRREE